MYVDHYGFYLNPSETVMFRFSPLGNKTFLEIILGTGDTKKTVTTLITARMLNMFRTVINRARGKLHLNKRSAIPGYLVENLRVEVDEDGRVIFLHENDSYTALADNHDKTYLQMGMLVDMLDSIVHDDSRHTKHLINSFFHTDKYMSETVGNNGVRIQLHHNLIGGYTLMYGTKHGNFFFPFNSVDGKINAELIMDIITRIIYLSHGDKNDEEFTFHNYVVKGLGTEGYDDHHISISRSTKEGGPSTMLVRVGTDEYRLLLMGLCSIVEIEMTRRQFDPGQVGGGRQRKWEKIGTVLRRIKHLYSSSLPQPRIRLTMLEEVRLGTTEELIEQFHRIYGKTRLAR